MLEIPSRCHRGGQSKDCNTQIYEEQLNEMVVCGTFGDIKHMFAKCGAVKSKFDSWQIFLYSKIRKADFANKICQKVSSLIQSFY